MSGYLTRSFARLGYSNLAAQTAEQLSLAAAPLVAVLALGAGPGEVGLLAAAQTLPFLLASMPLGMLADRLSRRRLIFWSEGLRALSLIVLLAALLSSTLTVIGLAVLGFVGAIGTVGFNVATPALVSSLVPRETLGLANARLELARSAAFTGGPALAGALVSWAGAPAAFILATVLSLSAITLVLRLVEPARHVPPRRDPLTEIYEGISFTWYEPMLRPMLITAVIYNISWFILQAVYVPHAIRVLGMSAHAVGLTLAMSGGGMATGAVISSRLITVLPFGRVIQIGPVLAVLAAALMVATIAFPHASLAGLSLALFGVGSMVWTISSTTLRQSRAAGPTLGRVSSVFLTATAGARPIGSALGAVIGTMWGDTTCLVVALVGFAIQACLILRSRIASLGHLPGMTTDRTVVAGLS